MLISLNRTQLFLLQQTNDGQRQASWRIWVLIYLLPVLFVLAAGLLAFDSYHFISQAERTTGEVVHVYAWDGWNPWDGDTTDFSPVFRYRFSDNELTEASTGQSSPNWNYKIGSQHAIYFNPHSKTDVKQNNFEQLWALPVTIGGIGLVLLLPALVGTFYIRKWLNNAPIKKQN